MSLTSGLVFEDILEANNALVARFWKFYKKRTFGPSYYYFLKELAVVLGRTNKIW